MNISSTLIYKYEDFLIYSYKLTNKSGFSCSISNYGATILSINSKDSNNKLRNLALSFKDFKSYINNSLYAGATLGPTAGRLSNGNLPLEGKNYKLSLNDNMNNLHGGFNNISFQIWNLGKEQLTDEYASITLTLNISHGVDGFPGNRILNAIFTLTNNNELKIKYEAISDEDTYLNLSNHCYFNLTGDYNTSILDHSLTIKANEYLENDESHCAYIIKSVANSPFDFSTSKKIRSNIDAHNLHQQLLLGKGYNNCFSLNKSVTIDNPCLVLESPSGDISLELLTDAPSVVLYTGGYIEEGIPLEGGSLTTANCALAIEPQDYPNGPNLPFVNTPILHKGERYERNIVYKFKILT